MLNVKLELAHLLLADKAAVVYGEVISVAVLRSNSMSMRP
jgi:hypothetical protein